jgi:hypothetical protein
VSVRQSFRLIRGIRFYSSRKIAQDVFGQLVDRRLLRESNSIGHATKGIMPGMHSHKDILPENLFLFDASL